MSSASSREPAPPPGEETISTPLNTRPPFLHAVAVSALTSVLFLVIYNACNWISSLRPDVQMAAFAWERNIPVVDWMIVPYWSLDAFFVVAPFLCRSAQDLRVLRSRLVWTNLIAGACFLIVPLVLAWQRPKVEGLYAPLFNAIQGMDAPHNLFPSLHIILRTVLAVHYARHSQGLVKWLLHIWFSLIGVSTLLTWQHHVMDVWGGFVFAGLILHIVPENAPEKPLPGNRRLGLAYLGVALLLMAGCRMAPPWTLFLAWPAAGLGTVSAAYLGMGAAVLGKKEGRLHWSTRGLLAPWRLGQWLSWHHYRRQSAPWDQAAPGVWVGALPDAATARRLLDEGVTHVLDMTAEFQAPPLFRTLAGYHNLAVADLTAPTPAQLEEAAAFIAGGVAGGGIVFIHCKAGYSRTAAAAGAWLILHQKMPAQAAMDHLRQIRPRIVIRPEIVQALLHLEARQAHS